ncbi:hypothetical protein DM794_05430 [Paenarthrobacter ureafaciens]|nr:hypothetical protein [Paenarthrobacter ureafaciens]
MEGHEEPLKWWAQQAESLQQIWTSTNAKLALGFDCRARTGDPYEFTVRYSPIVTADFPTPASLDEVVNNWIDPLRGVSTIAMGKKSEVTFVALSPVVEDQDLTSKSSSYFQLYGSGISQQPFAASSVGSVTSRPALRFTADGISLLSLIEGWQQHVAAGHPLFETYASVLGVPDDHPRNRFLLLLQALEGHYGKVNTADLADRQKEFDLDRSRHLDVIESSKHLDKDTRKFIKKYLSRKPPQGLDTSLRWAVKTLPSNVDSRIADSELVKAVLRDHESINDWSNALRQIRNDLAHGNRSYDVLELLPLTRTLDQVVRAHILKSLGADDDALKEMLIADTRG